MTDTAESGYRPIRHNSSYELLKPDMSEMRMVLLGNSWSERSSLANFMLGETRFDTEEEPDRCVRVPGRLKDSQIVLINTPDLMQLHIHQHKLTEVIEDCMRLSAPGPHVFLLVLDPEVFTEQHKLKLCRVLQLFGDQSFDHSLVLLSTPGAQSSAFMETHLEKKHLQDLILRCRQRHIWRNNLELSELDQILKDTRGEHLSCEVCLDEDPGLTMRPTSGLTQTSLNLVLCGRRRAGKTSAAKAILGPTVLHSSSRSSECVKHQGQVCGRQVSLVELPALGGKPPGEVMEESFRCVSLCDPEGIHAFILVLPVGPLTDENKEEFQTIQSTFSSRVNDFAIILLTVDLDPTHPDVVNLIEEHVEIQELRRSLGGRSVVINIKDQQQIPELLDAVDHMRPEEPRCFTKDMFTRALMEQQLKLQCDLQAARSSESKVPLRIVVIGRSGSGKGSTANTILGRKHFQTRIPPKEPSKVCEKATAVVHGRSIAVVYTPPLFDTTLSPQQFQLEIRRSISMLAPGPHVFLLVLQMGNFTAQEEASLQLLSKYFGKKSQDFTLIVFTRGDALEDMTFETYLQDCPDFVQKLIQGCGGRYQVLNNNLNLNQNQNQVCELLTKIDAMVMDNHGDCYAEDVNADVLEDMQVKLEALLKEKKELKEKEEDLKRRHEREVKNLKAQIEDEKKRRSQQLKEKDECINQEREKRKTELDKEQKRWRKEKDALRQDWRRKLEASEQKVHSEREQRENAEKKLELSRREMKKERDAWDKERKDIWEQVNQEARQNLEQEKQDHKKLQLKYTSRRRMWTSLLLGCLGAVVLLLLYFILQRD